MTINDFIQNLLDAKADSTVEIQDILDCAVSDSGSYEDSEIKSAIKKIDPENFTDFANKIQICVKACERKIALWQQKDESVYLEKNKKFKKVLENIEKYILEIAQSSDDNTIDPNSATLLYDINEKNEKKVAEITNKIKVLDEKVNNANAVIDNKIFSLLINTVAILGIFVAIAFAGSSAISFIPDINFKEVFANRETMVQGMFLMFSCAWIVYNLLLLLVYFIFQLSRPILKKIALKQADANDSIADENYKVAFSSSVGLRPFWVLDTILSLAVIGLFIACLIMG